MIILKTTNMKYLDHFCILLLFCLIGCSITKQLDKIASKAPDKVIAKALFLSPPVKSSGSTTTIDSSDYKDALQAEALTNTLLLRYIDSVRKLRPKNDTIVNERELNDCYAIVDMMQKQLDQKPKTIGIPIRVDHFDTTWDTKRVSQLELDNSKLTGLLEKSVAYGDKWKHNAMIRWWIIFGMGLSIGGFVFYKIKTSKS